MKPQQLPLWHIAHLAEWDAALRSGSYEASTRGRSLAEEGFIHLSYPHQAGLVARVFYADDPEALVMLEIDPAALAQAGLVVRVEDVGGGHSFPHLYGPLPTEAVVCLRALSFDEGGGMVLGIPEPTGAAASDDLAELLARFAAHPEAPPA